MEHGDVGLVPDQPTIACLIHIGPPPPEQLLPVTEPLLQVLHNSCKDHFCFVLLKKMVAISGVGTGCVSVKDHAIAFHDSQSKRKVRLRTNLAMRGIFMVRLRHTTLILGFRTFVSPQIYLFSL